MKTINRLIRAAESISTSARVGLDSQIKQVLPHKFKMTETNLVLSLSMSVSLPLLLIQDQIPKGLYQATDWRDGGQSSRRTVTRPHPYIHNHRWNNNKIEVTIGFLIQLPYFSKPRLVWPNWTLSRSQRHKTRPSEPASSLSDRLPQAYP